MNKKAIIYSFLIGVEIYARLFASAGLLVVLAIVGGLATMGGDRMESTVPDAFDGLGGYELIYFIMNIYIELIWILPLYILVAGREKLIYNTVKKFIIDRKEKKPIPKGLKYMMLLFSLYTVGYYIGYYYKIW